MAHHTSLSNIQVIHWELNCVDITIARGCHTEEELIQQILQIVLHRCSAICKHWLQMGTYTSYCIVCLQDVTFQLYSSTSEHSDGSTNTTISSCNMDLVQMWCCDILTCIIQLDRILYQPGSQECCLHIYQLQQHCRVYIKCQVHAHNLY